MAKTSPRQRSLAHAQLIIIHNFQSECVKCTALFVVFCWTVSGTFGVVSVCNHGLVGEIFKRAHAPNYMPLRRRRVRIHPSWWMNVYSVRLPRIYYTLLFGLGLHVQRLPACIYLYMGHCLSFVRFYLAFDCPTQISRMSCYTHNKHIRHIVYA